MTFFAASNQHKGAPDAVKVARPVREEVGGTVFRQSGRRASCLLLLIVIEIQPGHPEHTKLYAQTVFAAGDTSPRLVTLTTAYVSRHSKPGKPDLVATVSGFAVPVVFYNTGDSFSTEEPSA